MICALAQPLVLLPSGAHISMTSIGEVAVIKVAKVYCKTLCLTFKMLSCLLHLQDRLAILNVDFCGGYLDFCQ